MTFVLSIALAMALLFTGDTTYGSPFGKNCEVEGKAEHSSRSWFGVSVKDVSEEQAKELGLKKADGAYVTDVAKRSPAEAAGVREGDVIVEFSGRQIYDADGLVSAVRKTDVGATVNLTVVRKGERKNLVATVEKLPRRRMSFAFTPHDIPYAIRIEKRPGLGMSVIPLNPQLAKYFDVPDGKGLLVEEVKEGSAAEKAGFMAGDVITKIGDKRIAKVHEFRSELAEYDKGDKVPVEVIRKGSRKTLTVEIVETEEEEFGFFIKRFDELRPELERLQRELDKLKKRIEERINRRLIREDRLRET